MARPHSLLIEVAAGRPIAGGAVDQSVVDSAIEHRMSGLLLQAIRESATAPSHDVRARLEALDMAGAVQRNQLMSTADAVHRRLDVAGIDHLFFKGAVEAYRLFDDPNHRPFADLDVCIAPGSSLSAATAAIEPGYPEVEYLDELVGGGYLSSVAFFESGEAIDLHTDMVRVGSGARHPALWWENSVFVDIPGLGEVRALNREASFVVFLLHQARDRFRYLIGAAEFQRRLSAGLSYEVVRSLATAEGLWEQVAVAIAAMSDDLGIPPPVNVPRGVRTRLWQKLWKADIRLSGPEGRLRHTRRGRWMMPALARGRTFSTLRWIVRSAFPPAAHLRRRHPDARGPYLWRVFSARVSYSVRRRIQSATGRRE